MVLEHGKFAAAERTAKRDSRGLELYDLKSSRKPHIYEGKRRYTILVVDMLNDFVTGSLKCERASPIIPKIQSLLDTARSAGVPVVYANDSHRDTDFEIRARWDPHAMRGTQGAQVIAELQPRGGDHIVPKTSYSSFYNTDLEDVLRSLYGGEGANTLAITGLHTDCCVRHTCADAFFRGYESIIVEDGVNSFTELQHRTGLEYCQFWYNADLLSARHLLARLK